MARIWGIRSHLLWLPELWGPAPSVGSLSWGHSAHMLLAATPAPPQWDNGTGKGGP